MACNWAGKQLVGKEMDKYNSGWATNVLKEFSSLRSMKNFNFTLEFVCIDRYTKVYD